MNKAIDEHPNDDGDIYARKLQVDFQLIDLPLELNAVSDSPLLFPSVTSPIYRESIQTINELKRGGTDLSHYDIKISRKYNHKRVI